MKSLCYINSNRQGRLGISLQIGLPATETECGLGQGLLQPSLQDHMFLSKYDSSSLRTESLDCKWLKILGDTRS